MKRVIFFASLVILLGLALSFNQVFAADPGVSAPKKTPAADSPSELAPSQQHGKGPEMKESKQAQKEARRAAQQERKENKGNKDNNPSKEGNKQRNGINPRPSGKVVNFRGVIGGLSADGSKMDITLKDGSSVTVDMSQGPRIHIPTMGKSTEASNLSVGMQVSVHAVQKPEGGDPVVIMVQVIPGNPARQHLMGVVLDYQPGVSITIQDAGGKPLTFDITNVSIIPPGAVISAAEQTRVTVVCLTGENDSACTAQAVVVRAAKK